MIKMKRIILASTSTVYGSDFLEYLLEELTIHFAETDTILFIPYARPNGMSYDEYSIKANQAFNKINKSVIGIHEYKDPIKAIENAKGLFIGGGNTFVLLKDLYNNGLVPVLKRVLENGTPYLGTSAGSNICGKTVGTTNDMPIVYPPSFNALEQVTFNINPHYLDPDPSSKHMGETRETRINEFHKFNSIPVVGLREGSYLHLFGQDVILKGQHSARVFEKGKEPVEFATGSNLNNLS